MQSIMVLGAMAIMLLFFASHVSHASAGVTAASLRQAQVAADSNHVTTSSSTMVYRGSLIAIRYVVDIGYFQLVAVNPNDSSYKVLNHAHMHHNT